jgi:hypothetical protein
MSDIHIESMNIDLIFRVVEPGVFKLETDFYLHFEVERKSQKQMEASKVNDNGIENTVVAKY